MELFAADGHDAGGCERVTGKSGMRPVVEQANEGAALAQLRERGYADKYRASGEPIHLVRVEFSKETRNVTAFEVERA